MVEHQTESDLDQLDRRVHAEDERECRAFIDAIKAGHRTAKAIRRVTGLDELRRVRIQSRLWQRGEIEFDPEERAWQYVPRGRPLR